MTSQLSLQSRLFRKTGIAAALQLFKPESVPEALLWESSTIANLAQNPTYFPEFLQAGALDVLHLESNTIWNEVRLNAAWTFVFLTLQKVYTACGVHTCFAALPKTAATNSSADVPSSGLLAR